MTDYPGAISRKLKAKLGDIPSCKEFGAKGDANFGLVSVVAGTNEVTAYYDPNAPLYTRARANFSRFGNGTYYVGKNIDIAGAGPDGGPLNAVITDILSSTSCRISTPAVNSVSVVESEWGTDDTEALRLFISSMNSLRAAGDAFGMQWLFIPKGQYLISGPLTCEINRSVISGVGMGATVIMLRRGFDLPPEDETGKYAIFRTNNERNMGWVIRDLTLIGNGPHGSANNNGLVLMECQQNGILENVQVYNCGGHALFIGKGAEGRPNPESNVSTVRNCWFFSCGETVLKHDFVPGAWQIVYHNVHCERSLRGDGFDGPGLYENCHVEFTRYGFNIPDNNNATFINCTGYANPAFIEDWIPSIAMIKATATRGIIAMNCTSQFYSKIAEVGDVSYPEDGSPQSFALLSDLHHLPRNFHRTMQVGDFTEGFGTPEAVPLVVKPPAGIASFARFVLPGAFTSQFEAYASALGLANVLFLNVDVFGDNSQFCIPFAGDPTYQFRMLDLLLRANTSIGPAAAPDSDATLKVQDGKVGGNTRVRIRANGGQSDGVPVLEILNAGGSVVVSINKDGIVTLAQPAASRPLKLDSSNQVVGEKISVDDANEVQATTLTTDQPVKWDGSKFASIAGVTNSIGRSLTTVTLNYKDHSNNNQSQAVLVDVTLDSNAFTGGVKTT